MKRLKLKLSELQGAEILSREQLKNILGGDGSGSSSGCTGDSQCGPGQKCCTATDGSGRMVCAGISPSGGCPTSGVSGCSTKCTYMGAQIGCYYSPSESDCVCTDPSKSCI